MDLERVFWVWRHCGELGGRRTFPQASRECHQQAKQGLNHQDADAPPLGEMSAAGAAQGPGSRRGLIRGVRSSRERKGGRRAGFRVLLKSPQRQSEQDHRCSIRTPASVAQM